MAENGRKLAMGWLREYPDFRDFTPDYDQVSETKKLQQQTDSVKVMLTKLGAGPSRARARTAAASLPSSADLRAFCSSIEDQGNLGSCTAQAGVAMVEYFQRRASGTHVDASRLFLYKVTRTLMHAEGDTGAYLRTTMGALTLFGVPPEEYWPYDVSKFEVEPTPFCYAFAQNYQAISYYRLDPPGTAADALLARIQRSLVAGLPLMFGFSVYSSIYQVGPTGQIPFPLSGEQMVGGHAVMAVGYDDNLEITNPGQGATPTKGALLIRNSWGSGWGDKGYGWLPYEYVLRGLAVDWWSLLRNEWVDTGNFGFKD